MKVSLPNPLRQVLEVLEVGRLDTATGLSRLRCRAIIDQKDLKSFLLDFAWHLDIFVAMCVFQKC